MRARWLTSLAIALPLLTAGGCSTGATVDVRYSEETAHRGVLASAPPRRIAISPVADRRVDVTRIGSWPKDDGAIVTSRPVADIVHGALVTELTKNGHRVGSEAPDLIVAAAVEAFWLDTMRIYPGRQYLGRVVMVVTVTDGRGTSTLLSRRFIGMKRALADGTSARTALEVMDAALARAMRDLATDPDLRAALARDSRGVPSALL